MAATLSLVFRMGKGGMNNLIKLLRWTKIHYFALFWDSCAISSIAAHARPERVRLTRELIFSTACRLTRV
ncbi:hypothetical protein D1821_16170 [Phaeobacter inhibens]|nr:hypothetical protein D1821_16170 [Phaeobacter inhibens]